LKGKVLLMYDLMVDSEIPQSFNIPFNMYIEGSYFGDSDVLTQDREVDGRDGTALVDAQSVIYVICRRDLLHVLKQFKNSFYKEMDFIASERFLHHRAAIEELKLQNSHIKKRLGKNYYFMLQNAGKIKSNLDDGKILEDKEKDERYNNAQKLLLQNKVMGRGSMNIKSSKSERTSDDSQSEDDEID
jgi:hypothetical protein